MELIDVAAGVAVLLGAMLQAAVGFGFSLVCAPLVFAAAGPVEAVGLLTLLGLEVNLVSLLGERRRPEPLTRTVTLVLAWSVPGMVAGVAVLESVDAAVLQVALTVVVFGSLAVRHLAARAPGRSPGPAVGRSPAGAAPPPAGRAPEPAPQPPAGRSPAVTGVAGLAAGVLTTTTSAAGPPLVLLLLNRGIPPIRVRDTLASCFIGLSLLAIVVLAATGTTDAVPSAAALAALIPLAAAGQLLGRPLFAHLAGGHYELVLTLTLLVSATAGLVSALA